MLSARRAATLFLSAFLSLVFLLFALVSISFAQTTPKPANPNDDPANKMCKTEQSMPMDWTCKYDGKGAANAKGALCMLNKPCEETTAGKSFLEGHCYAQLKCNIQTYIDNYPDCKRQGNCKKVLVAESEYLKKYFATAGTVPSAVIAQPSIAGTGTNAPWQSVSSQLTAQQITAAFEANAAKPLDTQYTVNPVTGQLESLNAAGQSGGSSGDSNGSGDVSASSPKYYNYFDAKAETVSDIGNPVSQINTALNAPQPPYGSELSSESGFGSSQQTTGEQTSACTSGTWLCWTKQVYSDFTGGKWGGSAQAGTTQTDAEVIAAARGNAFRAQQPFVTPGSIASFAPPEQFSQPVALVTETEARVAANTAPSTETNTPTAPAVSNQQVAANDTQKTAGPSAVAPAPQSAQPLADMDRAPAELKSIETQVLEARRQQISDEDVRRNAAESAGATRNPVPPSVKVGPAILQSILERDATPLKKALQEAYGSQPDSERAVPVIAVAKADLPAIAEQKEEQTVLQMKQSSSAPLPAFMFNTEENSKSPEQRDVDVQVTQQLFAVWNSCPAADIACAQRAANLLQTVSGEPVENCPECQIYADKLRSGYKYENLIGSAPILRDQNMSAPSSVVSTAEDALQLTAGRRADLERVVADYVLNGPSPDVQNIIQNTQEGTLSKFFSVIEEKGHETGRIAFSRMPGEINSMGDFGKTIGWGIPGILGSAGGSIFGSARNLAEMTGVVPGFTGDLSRELGRKIDPSGTFVETSVDALFVSPFLRPVKGLAGSTNKGIDYAMGWGETGIARSEPGTLGLAGVRTTVSDIAESGTAGGVLKTGEAPPVNILPSQAINAPKEALRFEPDMTGLRLPRAATLEPAGVAPVAESGPAAQFNRARDAITDFVQNPIVETKAPETLGGMPKSGTIFDTPAGTTPAPGPVAALDNAVAEARAVAAGKPVVPVETPAAENVARPGSPTALSADVRALEPEVDKLSMSSKLFGTAVTGGFACGILGCFSSDVTPPKEQTLSVDLTSEKEYEALLPKTTPVEEPPAPVAPPVPVTPPEPAAPQTSEASVAIQEVTPPAAPASSSVPPAAEEAPKLASPVIIPRGESGAPKSLFTENKDAESAPPQSTNLGGPKPGEPGSPEYELQERRQRAAEEARQVAERVEAQRLANQREQEERERQWEAQRREVNAEIERRQRDLDARIEARRIADDEERRRAAEEEANKLPLPAVSSPVPGTGIGPTAQDIETELGGGGSGEKGQPVSLGIQFRVDSAALTNRADVEPLGKSMKELYDKGYTFNIQGNTDPNTPSSRWSYNNDVLGLERARTIQQTLATFYGIPLGSITISTMGARNLIYDNAGKVNFEASRRVIVTATPPKK